VTFDRVLLASDGKNIETEADRQRREGHRRSRTARQGEEDPHLPVRPPHRVSPQGGHRQDFTEVKIADVKVG